MATASISSHHPQGMVARRAPSAVASNLWRLLPLVALFYATLSPPEIQVTIAGQTLFAHRIVLLATLPWLLVQMLNGGIRYRLIDLLVGIGCVWMVVSFSVFYGAAEGITRGAALAMDNLLPYFLARASIRTITDLRYFLLLIVPGAFLVGVMLAIEAISLRQIVRPAAAAIFGSAPNYEGGQLLGSGFIFTDYRLGMLRAAGPFSHPIMAGMFLGSLLAIFFFSGLRGLPLYLGIAAGLLAFFSVSTAAILALAISIGMIGYDYSRRWLPFATWRLFAVGVIGFMALIQLVSQSGLVNILIRYTLDPATGYYRRLIWEYGIRSMNAHPLFGIGFTEYERLPWMVASVDAQWLSIGIKHGYITPVFFMAATVAVFVSCFSASSKMLRDSDRRLLVGVGISNLIVFILGFTVAFFGGVLIWVFMLLGIGASISMIGSAERRYPRPGIAART